MSMDPAEIRRILNLRVSELKNIRTSWEPRWRDIRDYILPDHGYSLEDTCGTKMNEGDERHDLIIDHTPSEAAQVLAAGLQSGMTNPSSPWFRLGVQDAQLGESKPVQEYLAEVERRLYAIFAGSNIYNAFHHVYLELGTFSTAPVAVLEDFDRVIRARPFTVGEYWLASDDRGKIDTVYRELAMTARQIKSRFGEDMLSPTIARACVNNPEMEFVIAQLIEPNDERLKMQRAFGRPFRSIYFHRDGGTHDGFLEVTGFHELPVMCPRWFVVGQQVYGRGPGGKVLGDVKMLQKLQADSLIALDKVVEPPMQAPGSMKTDGINSVPGGVTFYDDVVGVGGQGLRPLYEVRPDLGAIEHKIDQTARRIREGYFNQMFLMLAMSNDREMTAREVAEKHEEKLLMLGPVLDRIRDELLNPFIDRAFAIAERAELLPEPPPELEGAELKVEYISMLTRAQQMVEALAIEESVAFTGNLAGVAPEVIDGVDWDRVVARIFKVKGVDPKLLRDPQLVAQMRQARAQQAQQAAMAEQAEQAASAAKLLSEADTQRSSLLNTMLGGGRL